MICDDYQPYCLVCHYPEEFCNTCSNLASRRMKPLEDVLNSPYKPYSLDDFDCVWQLSSAR